MIKLFKMIGILDSTQHPLPQGILLLMEEILHQLRLVVFTILYRFFYIPGGAGFLPSTVGIYAYMFQYGLAKGTIIRWFSGSSHDPQRCSYCHGGLLWSFGCHGSSQRTGGSSQPETRWTTVATEASIKSKLLQNVNRWRLLKELIW